MLLPLKIRLVRAGAGAGVVGADWVAAEGADWLAAAGAGAGAEAGAGEPEGAGDGAVGEGEGTGEPVTITEGADFGLFAPPVSVDAVEGMGVGSAVCIEAGAGDWASAASLV